MSAYYNEIDKHAAAWLRELINAGHIADGIVDERSIKPMTDRGLPGCSSSGPAVCDMSGKAPTPFLAICSLTGFGLAHFAHGLAYELSPERGPLRRIRSVSARSGSLGRIVCDSSQAVFFLLTATCTNFLYQGSRREILERSCCFWLVCTRLSKFVSGLRQRTRKTSSRILCKREAFPCLFRSSPIEMLRRIFANKTCLSPVLRRTQSCSVRMYSCAYT